MLNNKWIRRPHHASGLHESPFLLPFVSSPFLAFNCWLTTRFSTKLSDLLFCFPFHLATIYLEWLVKFVVPSVCSINVYGQHQFRSESWDRLLDNGITVHIFKKNCGGAYSTPIEASVWRQGWHGQNGQ